MRAALGALLALAAAFASGAPDHAPSRVVSLNLVSDQLVVLLLPPERIIAVSHLAANPDYSWVAGRVARLRLVRGGAEEVARLQPDLVFTGRYTTTMTTGYLRDRGVPVVEVDIVSDWEGIRTLVRQVSLALDECARGEALIADMDRRLAALASLPEPERPLRVLSLGPNGFVDGAGTIVDAVIRSAGGLNALGKGRAGYVRLTLEQALAASPDLLAVPEIDPANPALAELVLLHPAWRRLPRPPTIVHLPSAATAAAGPFTVEAAEVLAAAMRARPQ